MVYRISTLLIVLSFSLASCKTYSIPVDSFRRQFHTLDSSYAIAKATPLWSADFHQGKDSFLVHGRMRIRCEDNQHQEKILMGGPSTQFRFTYGPNHKHTIVYFDTMFLTDSTVSGQRSRSMPWLRSNILLSAITKIEIQNDHKMNPYIRQENP